MRAFYLANTILFYLQILTKKLLETLDSSQREPVGWFLLSLREKFELLGRKRSSKEEGHSEVGEMTVDRYVIKEEERRRRRGNEHRPERVSKRE